MTALRLRFSMIEPLEARIAPAAVLYMSVDDDANSLYQIDPATGAATRIGANGAHSSTVGLTETTNPYVLYGSQPFGLITINADGSGTMVIGDHPIEAMAMDLSTGILYVEASGYGFFTLDPVTGEKIATLADPGADVDGLAYDGQGHIFGLAHGTGDLLKYEIANNTWNPVGSTGIQFLLPGLAFDPATGILYAKGRQDSNLYKIDPATAETTVIGDTGITNGGGLALIDNGLKIVNPKTATYTDGDGDLVTVKITQGTLTPSNFLLVPAPHGGAELWRLDLSDAAFKDTKVTITAKKTAAGGDGRAHVGFLDAGANDLGAVTIPGDLAKIIAGDGDHKKPAIASLTVGSVGVVDLAKNLEVDRQSLIDGDLGKFTVRGDFVDKTFFIERNVGAVTIGGSIRGGDAEGSGSIRADGTWKSLTVGGSIIGGDGLGSALITSVVSMGKVKVSGSLIGGGGGDSSALGSIMGTVGAVTIGQSLIGGDGNRSGIVVGASMGAVTIRGSVVGGEGVESGVVLGGATSITIGGSVIGGDGNYSGRLAGLREFGTVKIAGSLMGGNGLQSGMVFIPGITAKSVTIGGSIIGGDGETSGAIDAGRLDSVRVGGDVRGGDGEESGGISVANTLGPVKIGGSIVGGDGNRTGEVMASNIKSVRVGHSIVGGNGGRSGTIWANGNLDAVTVGGSLIGGEGGTSAFICANFLEAGQSGTVTIAGDIVGTSYATSLIYSLLGSWKSVSIGGSIIGGEKIFSGGVLAGVNLGRVTIKGSVHGVEGSDVYIRAGGQLVVPNGATKNVAIESLTIGGSVEHAQVLAGFGNDNVVVNGGVQIGTVTVGGNWSQSSIAAGYIPGPDNVYGTSDDTKIAFGPDIVASIASIVIKGTITGTYGGTDHYGFVATHIGKFTSGGRTLPLVANTGGEVFEVGFFTGDVTVREI